MGDSDIGKLFTGDASTTSVPVAATTAVRSTSSGPAVTVALGSIPQSTLDEPIFTTFKRDFVRIFRNVRLVLLPRGSRESQKRALRDWDLWGPMIFTLTLAITLSIGEKDASKVFALVFGVVAMGAVVLTLNVLLLGGSIVFFQSLSLLGYCLFPLNMATLLSLAFPKAKIFKVVHTLVLLLGITWASWASVPFVSSSVPEQRRVLAVYPVLLLYLLIGWLALVK